MSPAPAPVRGDDDLGRMAGFLHGANERAAVLADKTGKKRRQGSPRRGNARFSPPGRRNNSEEQRRLLAVLRCFSLVFPRLAAAAWPVRFQISFTICCHYGNFRVRHPASVGVAISPGSAPSKDL